MRAPTITAAALAAALVGAALLVMAPFADAHTPRPDAATTPAEGASQ